MDDTARDIPTWFAGWVAKRLLGRFRFLEFQNQANQQNTTPKFLENDSLRGRLQPLLLTKGNSL